MNPSIRFYHSSSCSGSKGTESPSEGSHSQWPLQTDTFHKRKKEKNHGRVSKWLDEAKAVFLKALSFVSGPKKFLKQPDAIFGTAVVLTGLKLLGVTRSRGLKAHLVLAFEN